MNREIEERRRGPESGFSLIELIVVITIIGILATAVVVNVTGRDDQARAAKVKQDFAAIKNAIAMYKMDNHVYPETVDELLSPPEGHDPYLSQEPLDPWTNEPYLAEPTDRGFYCYSLGADMVEGGEGYDADIYSDEEMQ